VVMKFADCWYSAENQRIFHIYLNQHLVYFNIDLVKLTGANTAITMHMYFTVYNNTVYYDGSKIQQNAGKVKIRFLAVKDNAILNAMVVFRGSIENLPCSLLHSPKVKKPPGFYIPSRGYENIFSFNANDESAVDSNGICFAKGEHQSGGRNCVSKTLINAPDADKKLYAAERYSKELDFVVPFADDGNYTVVMKFADCWYSAENQRIFNIYLNEQLVYSDIDLIKLAGANTAITMHMYFSVCNNTVYYNGLKIQRIAGKVNIRFLAVKDNAILNAMVVFRGSIENLPCSLLHSTKVKKPPGFYQCPSISNNNKSDCLSII
jgi:hypothetical protein